jgi:hypothetical protein
LVYAYYLLACCGAMTSERIRQELRREILDKVGDLATASRAIGRNHAYLQQFIVSGKPRYLHERDREMLARRYGINVEGLKPPVVSSAHPGAGSRPRVGDPIQDSREADIIYTWRQLSEEDKNLLFAMLDGIRGRRGLFPVAA